jgi:hypothetical protein
MKETNLVHFSQLSNSHLSTKGEAESGARIGESSQMESEYKRLCSKLLILKLLFNVEIVWTEHGIMVWVLIPTKFSSAR